jgi:ribonucleotide monophosphatase NagD (HAD superfamily)
MAAILLDVDGVFHVSREPIAGGAEAVERLRRERAPAPLRHEQHDSDARCGLAEELRGMGIELDDEELQTTPRAAAAKLAGPRVLALTMHAIVGELEGIELVGEDAEAVLVGGADETPETNLVFSYMNLARAFPRARGRRRAVLPAQEPLVADEARPALDAGAFVAGSSTRRRSTRPCSASRRRRTSRRRSGARRRRRLTWMVGDDIEADIAGAQAHGMRTVLVRTGKFRPDAVEATPDPSRRHHLFDCAASGLARGALVKVGVDLIEIERIRRALGALSAFPRPLLHRGGAGVLRLAARIPRRAMPDGSRARKRSARHSASGSRARSRGAMSRSQGRPKPSVTLSGRIARWAESRERARSTFR